MQGSPDTITSTIPIQIPTLRIGDVIVGEGLVGACPAEEVVAVEAGAEVVEAGLVVPLLARELDLLGGLARIGKDLFTERHVIVGFSDRGLPRGVVEAHLGPGGAQVVLDQEPGLVSLGRLLEITPVQSSSS